MQTARGDDSVAQYIICLLVFMDGSVQFYHQPNLVTIEIRDKAVNDLLTVKKQTA